MAGIQRRPPLTGARINLEGGRAWLLAGTLLALFLLTRPCSLPSNTYWDLALARDLIHVSEHIIPPEILSLQLVNSSPGIFGLKVLYHIVFFLLCTLLTYWAFRGEEVLPGIIVVSIFAFTLQPLLSLRWLLECIFVTGLVLALHSELLKSNFGWAIIPVTGAASALGLNVWVLVGVVLCYVLFDDEHRASLLLCALVGLLFFPEGAAYALSGGHQMIIDFLHPDDMKLLSLIAGMTLLPNLVGLAHVTESDLPLLVFYAAIGLVSLMRPDLMPIFAVSGTILLLRTFNDIKPLSAGSYIAGATCLTVIVHLFLFQSPLFFSLDTKVREELGDTLVPIVTQETGIRVPPSALGELAWKGIINLESSQLPLLAREPFFYLVSNSFNEVKMLTRSEAEALQHSEDGTLPEANSADWMGVGAQSGVAAHGDRRFISYQD